MKNKTTKQLVQENKHREALAGRMNAKCVRVDGKKIKADKFYHLTHGKTTV